LIACHWGAGDAIQAGNHQRRDPGLHRASLEHYRRALALSEQLVAANPEFAPDLRRLAKSCSRAAIVGELGKTTGDPALLDEALSLHARSIELTGQLLEKDPGNAQLRRSFAGTLIMKASVYIMAERDLDAALRDCERAIAIQTELAAADPANAEAQQDLSFAHYTTGRIHQLQGDRSTAAHHFRKSLDTLAPLISANPSQR
jgi:tetratricopeptide (TPR) repeat protein